MTLVDFMIIYIAFGSPVMVHRYLINRRLAPSRRARVALAGLAFWVPLVAQMGYRYFANAYSKRGFVSAKELDAVDLLVIELRTLLRREIPDRGDAAIVRREYFEALSRYAALSTALQTWTDDGEKAFNLFSIAETNREIGSICLIRRNHIHLRGHHIRAREDMLKLFSKVFKLCSAPAQSESTSMAIRIAQQFGDEPAIAELQAVGRQGKDRSWATQQHAGQQAVSPPLSALAISGTPPSSD